MKRKQIILALTALVILLVAVNTTWYGGRINGGVIIAGRLGIELWGDPGLFDAYTVD